MKKAFLLPVGFLFAGMLVTGCSSKPAVNPDRPVAEITAEAKTMAISDIKQVIAQYQSELEGKKKDIVALQDKIKNIPLTQLMGEEAKKLKADLTSITTTISALTERMNVYVKELQAKGGTL